MGEPDKIPPMPFVWRPTIDGDALFPVDMSWRRLAQMHFKLNRTYWMKPARSPRSERHYFACIQHAFENLPEEYAQEFADREQMRKYALITTNYYNAQDWVMDTRQDAAKLAAALRSVGEYSIVVVSECVVRRFTAISQSRNAMGKDAFQASKKAVLQWCADAIGVELEALTEMGKRSAGGKGKG